MRPYFHSAAPLKRRMIQNGVVGHEIFEGEASGQFMGKSGSEMHEALDSESRTTSLSASLGVGIGLDSRAKPLPLPLDQGTFTAGPCRAKETSPWGRLADGEGFVRRCLGTQTMKPFPVTNVLVFAL
jgi:hypothetical protein